jgi:hypothetical protein
MRKGLTYFLLLLVFAAFVFPLWNAVAAGLEDGLVLHLTFEEKDPVDHSRNPTDVSVKGSLKLVNGKIGKAAEFDGSTYVEVADADKLDGMDALTIAAWIQPGKPGGDGMSIASKRVDWQKEDAYNLFIYTGNKLDGRIDASGDFWSTTVFDAGTWYHIAYVFDGKANQQRIYVNGELDAEGIQGKSEVPEFNSPLWIGELNQGRNFIYKGLMDELGIWNRALDEDEIKLTMQGITTPVEHQGKLTTTWGDIKWEQ